MTNGELRRGTGRGAGLESMLCTTGGTGIPHEGPVWQGSGIYEMGTRVPPHSLLGAVHSHKLPWESDCLANALIDSLRELLGGRICGANDNACVLCIRGTVQAHEMQAIEGQHRTAFASGELQHFLVRNALVGASSVQGGQHIMA